MVVGKLSGVCTLGLKMPAAQLCLARNEGAAAALVLLSFSVGHFLNNGQKQTKAMIKKKVRKKEAEGNGEVFLFSVRTSLQRLVLGVV